MCVSQIHVSLSSLPLPPTLSKKINGKINSSEGGKKESEIRVTVRNGGGYRELESLWLIQPLQNVKPWPTVAMLEFKLVISDDLKC